MLQANQLAVSSGLNLKISGGSYNGTDAVAYKQEYDSGEELFYGSTVTVYFAGKGEAPGSSDASESG